MGRFFLAMLLFGVTLTARGQTNVASVAHLEDLVQQLTALHAAATNNAVRLACLTEKRNKLNSILALAVASKDRIDNHATTDEGEVIEDGEADILIACARADKIFAEAKLCDNPPVVANSRKRAARPANTNLVRPNVTPPLRGAVVRDEATCLKQSQLAALMVKVLELESTSAPMSALTQQTIEPLEGWDADACATVDDFCVVVARTLQLKVPVPDEPYSYVLACRQAGLPVDTLLPKRRQDAEPPILLEPEVRAFLGRGFAAPLSSSQRLQPD